MTETESKKAVPSLTRDTFVGPWAGLPVAWTDRDEFDEQTYRADVAQCCEAGVPGVYSGGTTGEFYAMELDEFRAVARATVDECHRHGTPAMVGCSSTYTLGVLRRAAYAAEVGADAIQVALPYWMELPEGEILAFFRDVASVWPTSPLSVYETTRAKRVLTIDQHRAIKDAVPNYLMVKANAGTVGCTTEGCETLSEFVNVFVGESLWSKLGPAGAKGSCSAMVYRAPSSILRLWETMREQDWTTLEVECERIAKLHTFLHETFGPKGLTDTAYDRMGGLAGRFLKTSLRSRGPYPACTQEDVEAMRQWCSRHYPEIVGR
ncbi:MAG: dihydrodipicolinate synthase family protein [Lentisphaeria bacterium]|nr:dihydrodipicolinate synthase family protein [Lentisphaeria bacterium]